MKKKNITGILAAFGMVIFIIWPDQVLNGASTGLSLCIKTVIPSLFPFFILSSIISGAMQGKPVQWLSPLTKLCGIPKGCESVILLGICGGYPIGAKSVAEIYTAKLIDKKEAERMLCFCNNAGPSFIFGMTASMFQSKRIPFLLWGIQILSMVITAIVIPNKSNSICHPQSSYRIKPIEQAIKSMATVCGWIIFMRVILSLTENFFSFALPGPIFTILTGILELSNGCLELAGQPSDIFRYILTGAFMTLGGVCILLQTKSLIGDLDIRYYIIGKLIQTSVALTFLFLSLPLAFPGNICFEETIICMMLTVALFFLVRWKNENNTGICRPYDV